MDPLHFVTIIACAALVLGVGALIGVARIAQPRGLTIPEIKAPPRPSQEKLLKLIYVIADMRGRGTTEANERIEMVQQKFIHLLQVGLYPLALGVNTPYNMRGFAIPLVFEESGKELCARCDGVLLMPGFDNCPEANTVFEYAKSKGLKIFLSNEAHIQTKLIEWAKS